jgi:predicted transcriptional regulator of viral defense system
VSQLYRFRYSYDMAAKTKYRDIVREIALDQYGYVTTKQAAEAGVPAIELPKLAARGGLENVAYGLYRVPDAPATAFDQFAEALARAGAGAYLHGDSVLALFGLADVNPGRVRVAVRRRTRPKLPSFIELTRVKVDVVTTRYEGLESQRVADAILECRGRIEPRRLVDAAEVARKEGLMTTQEWQRVRKGLRS